MDLLLHNVALVLSFIRVSGIKMQSEDFEMLINAQILDKVVGGRISSFKILSELD